MEDENVYNFTLEVDREERVDKLLANYFIEYSRSTIQKWIASKNVKINGKTCTQKDRIKNNCNVSILISSKPEINLIGENIDIDIIDETDDYIVVNKQSGMVTHIAPGNYSGTLQNGLYYHYSELANVPRTGIIHRLDKDTSGILLISRNLSAHNYLNKQLQEHKFKKIYHAVVSGQLRQAITVDKPIGRHPINRKKMTVLSKGKNAISIIKPLKIYESTSYIEIQIITGRTHQIRVHMDYLKSPIIGDKMYGYKKNIFSKTPELFDCIESGFGQYLHAYALSFSDPKSSNIKEYTATYPKEFQLLLDTMGI